MIKQIGLPRILLITRMITDRIGLHSALLPLLILMIMIISRRGKSLWNTKTRVVPGVVPVAVEALDQCQRRQLI